MESDATYRGTVYPWQCDHVGHMNIMWYVGKFDEANWNLFARIGLTPTYLRQSGHGMAAVQQNISYKRARTCRIAAGSRRRQEIQRSLTSARRDHLLAADLLPAESA